MGKKKAKIQYLEDNRNRFQTTYQRGGSLAKKAFELSILSGYHFQLILLPPVNKKLNQPSNTSSIQKNSDQPIIVLSSSPSDNFQDIFEHVNKYHNKVHYIGKKRLYDEIWVHNNIDIKMNNKKSSKKGVKDHAELDYYRKDENGDIFYELSDNNMIHNNSTTGSSPSSSFNHHVNTNDHSAKYKQCHVSTQHNPVRYAPSSEIVDLGVFLKNTIKDGSNGVKKTHKMNSVFSDGGSVNYNDNNRRRHFNYNKNFILT